MNKEIKYIPGDLCIVKGKVESVCEVDRDNDFSITTDQHPFIRLSEVKPIPLTPEILEKNGWGQEVNRGIGYSHLVYTKPDIEEYGYFPIYIEKGIGDEFDVYPFTDNNVCTQIAYIKYVHQLQHLLFGLGLNSEMEV